MERCAFKWLVNDVEARAELILVRERVHEIEPATEIDCELFERLPFVLQIEAVEVAVFVVVIDDAQRNRAGLMTVGIDRKNERGSANGGMLFRENETAANRVLVVEFVTRIELDAI